MISTSTVVVVAEEEVRGALIGVVDMPEIAGF
jgi:hypothetical protein